MRDTRDQVRKRLAPLALDPATEEEVVLELAQHIDDRRRDLLSGGTDENVAWARAWQELDGHPRLAAEIARARVARPRPPAPDGTQGGLAAFLDDLRQAWRRLRQAPGFAIVALLTITLTIGANTAILSVADAVLFRPLPYAEPDRVAILQMRNRLSDARFTRIDYQFLHAVAAQSTSVSGIALLEPFAGKIRPSLDLPDGRVPLPAMTATPNYFTLLGVDPAAGRVFADADASAEGRIAMLSHAAWQQYFDRDPGIIGRAVTFGDLTLDIVGVLPAGFVFPSAFAGRPALIVMRAPFRSGEAGGTFHPFARLAPGASRDRAQAEIDAASVAVAAALPRASDTAPVLDDVRAVLYPIGRPVMRYLLAAALFILLLGCANLANMMLVRNRRGLRDTAVRLALGASRTRLVRPIVGEALMLGFAGAVLAVVLASFSFDALLRQVPPAAYGRADVGVSMRVVLVALSMGVFCGLVFSAVPAWRVSGLDALPFLQRRTLSGRLRLGRPLLVAQVAFAVALVFGAAVASRAFVDVLRTPLGFSPEAVLRIGIVPPAMEKDRQGYYERVVQALSRRADVLAASAVGSMPFSGQAPDEGLAAPDGSRLNVGVVHALPGYFEVAGISVRAGRTFADDDARSDTDVVVVSESAARAMFGAEDPLGRRVSNGRGREFRVIGVVDDVRQSLGARPSTPVVYAIPGAAARLLTVVVRLRQRHEGVAASIASDLRAFPADRPPSIDWWADRIGADHAYRDPRFQTIVLGSLAGLAICLTALGIFSVVAYLVSARTREMGVRLAIGASPGSLVALIIRQAFVPVAAGIVAGLLLVQVVRGFIATQLAAVDRPAAIDTSDPRLLAVSIAAVAVAALAASYLPARRATRINPTEVLRAE